jgi:ABC-type multidrug transport system fused ATPase/permease subunit
MHCTLYTNTVHEHYTIAIHCIGEITSRLSNDTQQVAQQVELNVNVFSRSLLQALFILIQMAFISWELALTAFVSVPTIVFVSKVYGEYMRVLQKAIQANIAEANAVAEEVILHTVHCTLYTVHCTLYTIYYTLYTIH